MSMEILTFPRLLLLPDAVITFFGDKIVCFGVCCAGALPILFLFFGEILLMKDCCMMPNWTCQWVYISYWVKFLLPNYFLLIPLVKKIILLWRQEIWFLRFWRSSPCFALVEEIFSNSDRVFLFMPTFFCSVIFFINIVFLFWDCRDSRCKGWIFCSLLTFFFSGKYRMCHSPGGIFRHQEKTNVKVDYFSHLCFSLSSGIERRLLSTILLNFKLDRTPISLLLPYCPKSKIVKQ